MPIGIVIAKIITIMAKTPKMIFFFLELKQNFDLGY
jgi:hypothetical protein